MGIVGGRRFPVSMVSASPHIAQTPLKIPMKAKKVLVRRSSRDRSQLVRHAVQFGFLALNAWIGVQFILWVRFYESQGSALYVGRPAGVDGWLPIAGLMNLRYSLATGNISQIHPSAMVLFCAFLLASLLIKKSFCSWLCPVGTVSEYLWKIGRKLVGRSLMLPRWLDWGLRSLKYLLLAFFVFIVFTMSTEDLGGFLGIAVRHCGRREDAELLPAHWRSGAGGDCGSGGGVVLYSECMVPLSMPLRCADGGGFNAEPGEDSAR
jgi:hypothetical protein